jgi:hypothetical protein
LGVLHRAALGEGPPQLQQIFKRRPGSLLLQDPYDTEVVLPPYMTSRHPIIKRSTWGLIRVTMALGAEPRGSVLSKIFRRTSRNGSKNC